MKSLVDSKTRPRDWLPVAQKYLDEIGETVNIGSDLFVTPADLRSGMGTIVQAAVALVRATE